VSVLLNMPPIPGLDARGIERARLTRDPRADGTFFIAVTSTGIYCRPICRVRSPRRENIRYYPTAAAAAAAGFRPCLRCRPERSPGMPLGSGLPAVVRRALRLIDDRLLDGASAKVLASRLGARSKDVDRLFIQHVGASPLAVAGTRRLHFAKRLLDETNLPMTEVALAAGFRSVRCLTAAFQNTYRRTPAEIRKRRRPKPESDGEMVLALAFRPPYDWAHMHGFLAVRAISGVERVDHRGYARTIESASGVAIVSVRPLEGEHALELRVRGAAPAALSRLYFGAQRAFDVAGDPAYIARALGGDSLLGRCVTRRPGIRVPGAWDPFECAVRATLGQQVSVAAARTFSARLVERAGRLIPGGSDGLTHLFPSPAALAAANLDGLGLTGARVAALHTLARAVIDGALDFDGPSEQVMAGLTALPGFGVWTAQYIALRALHDPDAFPAADIVLRRVAGEGGASLTERGLEARADAWRPWRGYAAIHLWRAAADVVADAAAARAASPQRGQVR
jgi:AraC family transcriptional regulator of adaptative response / DNA-3-methyladenine glycosylase II